MMYEFLVGVVGKSHRCNNNCGRYLRKGEPRIEGLLKRFCLVCGHKKIQETIKMMQDNLKEVERTHLKEIVAMRMKGI